MSERFKDLSTDSMHNRPLVIANHFVHLLQRTVARKCNNTRNYRLINDHNRFKRLLCTYDKRFKCQNNKGTLDKDNNFLQNIQRHLRRHKDLRFKIATVE